VTIGAYRKTITNDVKMLLRRGGRSLT
jgi:hypothetical protein